MRQRNRRLFVQRCTALIADLGGVHSEGGLYEWELPTNFGRLCLSVVENTTSASVTVLTRFVDAKAAHPQTACNPYSGKWNHHYFDGWMVDAAVIDFERCLRSVLPVAVCAASAS